MHRWLAWLGKYSGVCPKDFIPFTVAIIANCSARGLNWQVIFKNKILLYYIVLLGVASTLLRSFCTVICML